MLAEGITHDIQQRGLFSDSKGFFDLNIKAKQSAPLLLCQIS